jgi:hypothetical protein
MQVANSRYLIVAMSMNFLSSQHFVGKGNMKVLFSTK